MEKTRYIYLADNIDLPEFKFIKGSIYYGDKIDELIEKYPLLSKILIDTEKLSETKNNELLFNAVRKEILSQIEEGGSK